MSPRLAFALEAASRAGKLTLAHFQTAVEVEMKADSTPVTIADKGAESLIRRMIEKEFPGEHVLGEEEGGSADISDRWIIDPIDGTKSFISGVPLYSTLLSYEQNFEPIIAVAFFPALNEAVYAEKGKGTFLNGKPVQVKATKTLDTAVICCGGHKTMTLAGRSRGLEELALKALVTRTWGDAYGHALVATGRADAMIDPVVSRWDISSMNLIVQEAGGQFTDFSGGPALKQRDRLEAISSNGLLHSRILEAFSS